MHWLIFSTFLVSTGAIDHVVRTTHGLVGGIEEKTVYGTKYLAYYSIPFAAPPVGSLRLKPPVDPRPWFHVRNGTKWPSACLQPTKSGDIIGDEDCLYLNVFTPSNNSRVNDALWPVIVYLHPGAYRSLDSSKYPPGYILEKPVILITFNYRLGPLGFMGYGTNELSGNFGLKDQVFVLKWIQKNIAAFGGNPNEVTLLGNSAGSMASHFHLYSPLSKGLFHRAILQSGLGTFGFYDINYARAQTIAFAVVTGCYRKHVSQMFSCFQTLKPKEFTKAMKKLYTWGSDPGVIFRPIIEGEGVTDAALPKEPTPENYQSQSIPVIFGINTGEAGFRVREYLKNDGKLIKELNEDYHRLLPVILGYQFTIDKPEKWEKLTNKIVEYYLQGKSIGVETDVELVRILTDVEFLYPHVEVSKHYPATKYFYVYDYKANCSGPGTVGCYKDEYGVDHGDEIPMFFPQPNLAFDKMTVSEKFISAKLVEFFTNFAIYSNPNGPTTDTVWLPVISKDNEYLYITKKEISMKNNYNVERAEFLQKIFSEI